MSDNPFSENPYQPTAATGNMGFQLEPADVTKVEAIIKDAGQFWLAIILCFLCTLLGSIIIGPWYLVRLLQWHSMSQKYPQLIDPAAPVGSLPKRFQSSRWKLIVGLVFGLLIFALGGIVVLLSVVGAAAGQ